MSCRKDSRSQDGRHIYAPHKEHSFMGNQMSLMMSNWEQSVYQKLGKKSGMNWSFLKVILLPRAFKLAKDQALKIKLFKSMKKFLLMLPPSFSDDKRVWFYLIRLYLYNDLSFHRKSLGR